MGRVLLAVRDDPEFRQRVAIKIADRSSPPEILERLRIERQILADLEHPNIARLLDGGSTGSGHPYLVVEYVDGQPLDRTCDRLPLAERLALLHKVLAAVAHAHRHLVLHLDLKPANILVNPEGQPKLLDFGISKLLGAVGGVTRAPDQRPFTPAYASPEQVRGERLTTASDVYSLGLVLYRLLTGRLPEAHRNPDGPDLVLPSRTLGGPSGRRLQGDLDAITAKALQRVPEDRYPTVEQFAADLELYLEGRPILARPATWSYRAGRFVRRHRQATALCGVLLGTLLTAAGTVVLQTRQLTEERDRTELAQAEAESVAKFFADLVDLRASAAPAGSAPTVIDALDRGRKALEGLSAAPPVRARLLHSLGATYRNWGRLEAADQLLEEALAIRRRALDAGHPRIAETLDSLGRVARARADFPRALELHREALDVLRRHFGEDDLTVADSYIGLGNTLYDLLEMRAALSMYRRACDIRRRHLGDRHRQTAACLSNLAKASSDLGRYDDGVRFASEAVAISEKIWPGGHPSTATALNILAQSLVESRQLKEAEPVMRRVVDLRRRFLDPRHPLRIEALNNLALVVGHQGRHAEAEQLLRECLELVLRIQGADHQDTVKATYNLGKALFVQGRLREAEPLLRQSLDIARRLQGDSDGLAYPLAGLAQLLLADGRPLEALTHAEEAHRRALRALGPEHRLTRDSHNTVLESQRRIRHPAPQKES